MSEDRMDSHSHIEGSPWVPIKRNDADLDTIEKGILKRRVQKYHYTEQTLPNVISIIYKAQKDINFYGYTDNIKRLMRELGFRKHTDPENREYFLESTDTRLKRIEYLQALKRYRNDERPIVYTVVVVVAHKMSKDPAYYGSVEEFRRREGPIKRQCIAMLYAGTEYGYLPKTAMCIKTIMSPRGNNVLVGYDDYENWVKKHLIPNLPFSSVVVMRNASYNNKIKNLAPRVTARKDEMEDWLMTRGIPFLSSMHKPQLYKLICLHRDKYQRYAIDEIFNYHDHIVLRLPPYHPDLNPLQAAWENIKDFVEERKQVNEVSHCAGLIRRKLESICQDELATASVTLRDIEDQYEMCDIYIDALTDQVAPEFDDYTEEDLVTDGAYLISDAENEARESN